MRLYSVSAAIMFAIAAVALSGGAAFPAQNTTGIIKAPTTHKPTKYHSFAGTSITCGGSTYHVSTGTGGGTCTHSVSGGKESVSCTDGGNTADASCGTASVCGGTSGAGDCAKAQ